MVEAQLDYFAQAMLGEAAAMKRRLARANTKKSEAAIISAINDARDKVANNTQEQTQRLRTEHNKKLAMHVVQSRERYWQRKEELLYDLFAVVETSAKDFTLSDAYPPYMEAAIRDAAKQAEGFTIVQLTQRDVTASFQLPEGIVVETAADDFLGGFILLNEARTQQIDCTLQTRLIDRMERFDEWYSDACGGE